ncbi:deoxyguanosinetriphosphate triphosphohydrolase [Paenibacillus roseipurpureus]|uniref:Deoxyguanosinetriphosphate triphosphohydrolase n=1 Tax=Paenibacillus roseopurpureus TaxID=2918901 RepID=A0AA96LR98_9BACL|nr:deoxyguanosinetriphosphate triphosphohydrolase [Paenibacillus sp. MBLB1832]WNR45101.1 deoxyguanosinetriphosphate triphosphohydrolase [Paenibacillus sp. MBLB1832]
MSEFIMDWENLLSEKRKRGSNAIKDFRNGFDMDYDRIISSSSLRRLQDKAQVFPLQDNDFIRTRLTHSLEVSSIGRSFGYQVGQRLIILGKIQDIDFPRKISSLLAVACLVHDIGNPPFGHFGEDVIQNWFKEWLFSKEFKKLEKEYILKHGKHILSDQQKNDFMHFEGNAQALRILTKLQFLNDQYGINFTYATLAVLLKYPRSSLEKGKYKDKKSFSKFGYFTSERSIFEDIKRETGIGEFRHPLTFLMESADDIAYSAADVEDGVKKNLVPWENVYLEIKEALGDKYSIGFKYLEKQRATAKKNNVPDINRIHAQNFRVWAQGEMIKACANEFIRNYDQIIRGEYDKELINESSAADIKKKLDEIAIKYCYPSNEVITLELVGDSVIRGLLDMFVPAIIKVDKENSAKKKENKLYHLISENFRYIQKLDEKGEPNKSIQDMSLYDKLMLITDFISGMTDTYAVDLFQRLSGVKLP